jgi:hypothetical protein
MLLGNVQLRPGRGERPDSPHMSGRQDVRVGGNDENDSNKRVS